MPAAEISIDRDPVGAGREFAVAIRPPEGAPSAPRTGPGASYAIVLDASQSMSWQAEQAGGPSRWTLALGAVRELLRQLPDEDEIQVVAFNDHPWAACDVMTVAVLRSSGQLEKLEAPEYGYTNIELGLRFAYDRLHGSAAPARRAILFSDGLPNAGVQTAAELGVVAAGAADRDVYTDAVGLGKEADFELLQAVSARGSTGHVTAAAGSQAVINDIVRRLAKQTQDLTAAGGELIVGVHPYFPVRGVYQVHPVKKRLEVPVHAGQDGGQEVAIPLGAVGTRDERPMFVLRLEAPNKPLKKHLPIVKTSGHLRTGSDRLRLDEANCAVSGIADKPVPANLDKLMREIRAIDLEAEVAKIIKDASPSAHADLYAEARDTALREGLTDLAAQYDIALRSLREGLDPNDVRNGQRALSSTSTGGNPLLEGRPKLDPNLVRGPNTAKRTIRRDRTVGEP